LLTLSPRFSPTHFHEDPEFVLGSPLNALHVDPPFTAYHLIDLDRDKVEQLRELIGDRENVFIYESDCNEILLGEVFPQLQWRNFRRGLVLLDPYGLDLSWDVIRTAGQMRTVDLFLNFPVMDMNRNVLWAKPDGVDPEDVRRMNRFWGDESWRTAAYGGAQLTIFGEADPIKRRIDDVVDAFRERLREVAGFGYVPDPLPMRNSTRAVVYYLFFASQKQAAGNIITDIFAQYRNRGA